MTTELISRDQALERIRHHLRSNPLPPQTVSVSEALGHISAQDLFAAHATPAVAKSSVDGYAVFCANTAKATPEAPVRLEVKGEVRPSTGAPEPLAPGTACHILTGGALPPGADAVIPFEDVTLGSGGITMVQPVVKDAHVRAVGSDLKAGTRVLRRGEDCTPTALSCLAVSGVLRLPVYAHPKALVLAVGNELCGLDDTPAPGQMPADNLLLAAGLLRQRGFVETGAEATANSLEHVTQRLNAAGDVHCIITTGGTGPGQRDFMLQAAQQAGFTVLFQGMKLHPGKSVFCATRGRTLLFALPGTPWAVFALMHALVLPAACWLRGRALPAPVPVLAKPVILPTAAPQGWEKLVACTYSAHKAELLVTPLLDRTREARLDMMEAQGLLLVPAHMELGDLLPMIPIWEHRRGHRP